MKLLVFTDYLISMSAAAAAAAAAAVTTIALLNTLSAFIPAQEVQIQNQEPQSIQKRGYKTKMMEDDGR